MIFEQILKQEGRYRTSTLSKGTVFSVQKGFINKTVNELNITTYSGGDSMTVPATMTETILNSNFRRVNSDEDVYKDYTELVWE